MTDPRVAVVFPGYGSLRAGLARQWYGDPAAHELFDEASEQLGRDVVAWWQNPVAVSDPVVHELAIFVCGVAAHRSLHARGLEPAAVAGHSAGEFAALEASGALQFAELLEVVRRRAQLVAVAAHNTDGAMAAVAGRDAAAAVADIIALRADDEVLVVANENGPHQVVMAGDCDAVERAGDDVRDIGLRYSRLDVPGALHSPLMQAAADRLDDSLAELIWSTPTVPVVPNVDAVPTRDPSRLRRLLRRHLTSPVRWAATSRALAALDIDVVVECGGSCTLGPFIRQVNPFLPTYLLSDPRSPLPEFCQQDVPLPVLSAELPAAASVVPATLTPLELSATVPARPGRALQAAASITPA